MERIWLRAGGGGIRNSMSYSHTYTLTPVRAAQNQLTRITCCALVLLLLKIANHTTSSATASSANFSHLRLFSHTPVRKNYIRASFD